MIKEFKEFLLRGNLLDLAVAVVIGAAFTAVVASITSNIITPLINSVAGGGSTGQGLGWTINGQRIDVGAFISAIIYFIIFMAVVYYLIVVPYRTYMARRGTSVFGEPAPTKACPQCLSGGLPVAAAKCKFCASEITD